MRGRIERRRSGPARREGGDPVGGSVRETYAGGILTRALDPANQTPAIRALLAEESDPFESLVVPRMRVVDFGCGTGRHLARVAGRLSSGLGVDYERAYIAEAIRSAIEGPVHFVVADATAVPTTATFDLAVCLTNTWATMKDKVGVLWEMRRLAPRPGTRMISVFSPASVPARCEWYGNIGHEVVEVTDEAILAKGGFRSEVFTEARLRALVGDCEIQPIAGIGWMVFV